MTLCSQRACGRAQRPLREREAQRRERGQQRRRIEAPGLDEVAHQVYLSVHERGTEAAAATAILMIRRAVNGHDEGPVSFRADRPFLFLVRDTGTGIPASALARSLRGSLLVSPRRGRATRADVL